MRTNRRERWYFVDLLLDALEHLEALDTVTAGELVAAREEDPVGATTADCRGLEAPFAGEDVAGDALNNPRR